MAKIIDLSGFKKNRLESEPRDLNEFLTRAKILIREQTPTIFSQKNSMVKIKDVNQLKMLLEKGIAKKIIEAKEIDQGVFLCGIYVSIMLTDFLSRNPESWIASDYIISAFNAKGQKVGIMIQRGADVCFFICSIFPKRGNWRSMKIEDYQKIGSQLYYRFYLETGKEIGYYMNQNFEMITNITKDVITSL